MKLYGILFIVIFLISLCTASDELLDRRSLQDYIDSFIDIGKLKNEGVLSLNGTTLRKIWSFFKAKYHRSYSSTGEEGARLHIFRDHLKYVLESNLQKLRTFQLELNEFSDWTLAEFNALKKGLNVPASLRRDFIDDESDADEAQRSLSKFYQRHYHARRLKRNLKKRRYKDRRFLIDWFDKFFNKDKDKNKNNTDQQSKVFDWRTKNVVSSIKNQGKCGSCYAFATVAVMETLYAIKTKSQNVIDFSPQQIVDCSSDGNDGCDGGNFPPSVNYLSAKGGKIATNASYPYAEKQQSCRTSGINEIDLGKVEFGAIPLGDEKKMAEALTNYGPIFIGLDADSELFMFYKNGILQIDNCPKRRQDMDHAMTIVGYGYDDALQTPYWIIKNSWGIKWGENGYLRLIKDAGNMCGVASMAYYGKLT
ncbi:unnamed protein product [Rotaria sordida]|uniref:Uncharacterized protein n=1 Tax=Rotaria sordida TaxID=392033 RepID=A0A819LHX4_9BILA|nr:unnamed protein product [Rotaria sordida]